MTEYGRQAGYQTGVIEVAPGAYAFIQEGGATDAGFLVEEEGVVIIDTLMTRTLAERLLAEAARVTDKPVRYVVNTHWHGDHLFGNALMPEAPIIAHDTCREDLFTEWTPHREFLRDLYPAMYAEWSDLPQTPPNLTFSDSLTIHLGPRPIELRFFGKAHTRGDVAVHLPTEGVLFAGDLSFHKYIPNARDGFPQQWASAVRAVEQVDCGVVVPGHGPLGTRADLAEMRECLELIVEQGRRSFESGLSEGEARAALDLGPFSDWGRQEDRLPTLMSRLYSELRGELD